MKMLLPLFNFIGENGVKDISFAYSHLTKVKQNFFLLLRVQFIDLKTIRL
jgi:hypothetical protein